MTSNTKPPRLSPAYASFVDEFVDDLVDAIRVLAAALVGKASHPDKDDTEGDEDS